MDQFAPIFTDSVQLIGMDEVGSEGDLERSPFDFRLTSVQKVVATHTVSSLNIDQRITNRYSSQITATARQAQLHPCIMVCSG